MSNLPTESVPQEMNSFKIVPYASESGGKRCTRKRNLLAMKMGEYFPGEGHLSFEVERTMPSECGDLGQLKYICIGGHRRDETISGDRGIFFISFLYDQDDVILEEQSFQMLKYKGAKLPLLHSPCGLFFKEKKIVVIHGGLRLDLLFASTELYTLNMERKEIQILNQINTPSGRYGHTMTQIDDNNIIMHGGAMTDLYNSSYMVTNHLRKVVNDAGFYLFTLQNCTWQKLPIEAPSGRAWHSAHMWKRSIYYIGGIKGVDGPLASHRISLREVVCLNVLNMDQQQFSLQIFCLQAGPKEIYLSNHGSCLFGDSIIIYGGIQLDKAATEDPHDIDANGSSQLCIVDLNSKEVKLLKEDYQGSDLRTRGNSLHIIDEYCIMILGGTMRGIVMFTQKTLAPTPCGLEGNCKISENEILSPIEWLQCDGQCKIWFHNFCVDLKRAPKKWYCGKCIKSTSKGTRGLKRSRTKQIND